MYAKKFQFLTPPPPPPHSTHKTIEMMSFKQLTYTFYRPPLPHTCVRTKWMVPIVISEVTKTTKVSGSLQYELFLQLSTQL